MRFCGEAGDFPTESNLNSFFVFTDTGGIFIQNASRFKEIQSGPRSNLKNSKFETQRAFKLALKWSERKKNIIGRKRAKVVERKLDFRFLFKRIERLFIEFCFVALAAHVWPVARKFHSLGLSLQFILSFHRLGSSSERI